VAAARASCFESGILPSSELDEVRKQLTEDQYAQEYECDFSAALAGAYFGKELVRAEREGRIRRGQPDLRSRLHRHGTLATGTTPLSGGFRSSARDIHLIDFHASSGQSVKFYCKPDL